MLLVFLIVSLTVFVLVPSQNVHASSPIVFDAANSANCATLACLTLSWSHTVGTGFNRILIISVFELALPPLNTVSSVTYGASTLTFIGSHIYPVSTKGEIDVEMWSLLNPPAGAAPVTVTLAASDLALAAGSVSYFNTAGTGFFVGIDDGGSGGSNPSLIVNSNPGELVVDTVFLADDTSFTASPGSMQTERWTTTMPFFMGGPTLFSGGSDQPASSPVTMTWTSSTGTSHVLGWILDAVTLIPTAIPTTPVPEYPLGLPLLTIFMVLAYGLIKRRTGNPENT